jgi:hypothetical protein
LELVGFLDLRLILVDGPEPEVEGLNNSLNGLVGSECV